MQKILLHAKKEIEVYDALVGGRVGDAALIAAKLNASKAAIVCSAHTRGIAQSIASAAKEAGLPSCIIEIEDGEEHKGMGTLANLLEQFRRHGLNRDAAVIAVGGGTLGDVAGFAASVYLRGISLIHVPTTLLAMADSSIGGKTGVNLDGKNTVGSFHQPKAVVIDFSTLKTLPPEEVRQGFAEIIKAACIRNAGLFRFLEENSQKAISLDEAVLVQCVTSAIEVKADIVAADEREGRRVGFNLPSRMLLNFGHSVGHALEKASRYTLKHGDAVSVGMSCECAISHELGMLSAEDCLRVDGLLHSFGLPTCSPGLDARSILAALLEDKKNRLGTVVMALPAEIGRVKIVSDVPLPVIVRALEKIVVE